MFLKQMQVGHMAVFAYIVGDKESGEGLVIDPAADTERILSEAAAAGITIRYIINTHGHVDHTSGNAAMKDRTGAEIIIHRDDADMLVSTPSAVLRMFGAKLSPPADRTVQDGEDITIGKVVLQVIHTPGHSPGGMSLYTPGYVFTGDTLFVEGLGRTDLPGGSWNTMHESITKRLLTL
ncbi:MAG: MBL fold metallo-hydrolase, partial [Deltaproteobacteria bacterium]|nr:MBL fold metallo-hydrolase [Deltaproteobacteria bacterium]